MTLGGLLATASVAGAVTCVSLHGDELKKGGGGGGVGGGGGGGGGGMGRK